eukprot:8754550-Prorocentrum_lima.AAC.1
MRTLAAMGCSLPVGSVGMTGKSPGACGWPLGAPAAGTPLLALAAMGTAVEIPPQPVPVSSLPGIRGVGGTSSSAPA